MIATAERLPYGADLWRRMRPVWSDLLARTKDPSAFLSGSWVGAWLEVFGPDLRPTGLVWCDGEGAPVACALLSVGAGRLGPFPITRSFLNASGAGVPGCEHNDMLVVPEFRGAVLEDVVRIVREIGTDELALVGFREETAGALRSRWPSRRFEGYFSEAPYVSLERLRSSGTPYLSSLSSNTRSQVRRSIRLYEEMFGELAIEVAEARHQAEEWLSQLVGLHEERWSRRGQPGAFSGERSRRFHASILEQCVGATGPEQLGAELVRIRFGEETVGFLYNLTYRGRVSFYQSGLRYHGDNRLKPGLVAHALAVEHYLTEGREEYDFLGGEPEAVQYKRSLSTDVRTLAWIQLPAPSLKIRLLSRLRRARRYLRSVRRGN